METDRLKYFSVIAESGSLTAAATLLGISHSGLSKAMALLEQELEVKLFRPQGRGLEITEEGKLVYQKAKKVLNEVEALKCTSLSSDLELRIGLSEVLGASCTELIFNEVKLPLTIFQGDLGEIETQILERKLDFGVLFSPSPNRELDHLPLGQMEFNAYAREDLIKRYPGNDIPFIVPASPYAANPLGYSARDGWPSDLSRNPQFKVNNFAIAISLVRNGKGATYMPNFIAKLEEKIRKVRVFESATSVRKVYLVKRKDVVESGAMKKTAKIIRSLC